MIEHQLKEYFADSDAIRDRVGSRIYPGRALQGIKGETLIIQEITSQPVYDLTNEAGQHDKSVQVDCYAATPRSAASLAELVRNRLSGYRGTIGTTNPITVQSCRITSAGQETESPADSSDKWTHRYRLDFAFFSTATIPTFT